MLYSARSSILRGAGTLRRRHAIAVTAVLFSAAHAFGIAITVNLSTVLTPVPAAGVGLHSSVYANQWTNPNLPAMLQAAGIQSLRFPGGSYSDIYHFSNNTAPGGYVAAGASFAQFARIIGDIGAAGMVTVDYGSSLNGSAGGQPQEAAAWVAYANGSTTSTQSLGTDATGVNWKTVGFWASLRAATPLAVDDGYNFLRMGHSAPLNVEQWEIGNEIFGNGYYGSNLNWEEDNHSTLTGASRAGVAALSPTTYGQDVAVFSAAMKAVDPNIKIGVVLTTPGGTGSTSNPATNWNSNVLQQCGSAIDFGIIHYYSNNGTNTATEDANLLASPTNDFSNFLASVRSDITTYAGRSAASVPIDMTELGYFGNVSSPRITALYAADAYAMALSKGVNTVDWLEMSASTFMSDTTALTPGPAYFAIESVAKLVSVGGNFVSVTSGASTLHAYVASSGAAGIAMMFINEDLVNPASLTVTFPNGLFSCEGAYYLTDGTTLSESSFYYTDGTPFAITVPAGDIATYVLYPVFLVPEPSDSAVALVALAALRRRARR
jgi:hypothetical protein